MGGPVTDDLSRALLDDARHRLVTHFPAQVRACLEVLSDEQLWWRPNEGSNSVGNLVLHLCGSTRHFLGRGAGGTDYARDRPREFAERGPIPAADLKRILEETVAEAARVLAGVGSGRLLEVSGRVDPPQSILSLILRTSHHWAAHTGQIVYAAKLLKERPFDELWMKTLNP
jgi:uncharacterized damage-inducible protein DinB